MEQVFTAEEAHLRLREVVMALVAVERCLPSSELDTKLHNPLHLVGSLHTTGPLYATSMFPYESLYGMLTRWAKNRRAPEVHLCEITVGSQTLQARCATAGVYTAQ